MTSSTSSVTPTTRSTSAASGVCAPRRLEAGTGERQAMAAAGPLDHSGNGKQAAAEPVVQGQPPDVESLPAQGKLGAAMELRLRGRDAELPAEVDRPIALAAPGAVSKAGPNAARPPRRDPELLPDQGSYGSG